RATGEHCKLQGIERAQLARVVRRLDRGTGIAGLGLHEAERVVAEREIRAELDAAFELDERLALRAAQPQGAAHRPVRGGIAVVGAQALAGGLERELDL